MRAGKPRSPSAAAYCEMSPPKLVLEEYFSGALAGHGATFGRFGSLTNQFIIQARGMWNGSNSTLALEEIYRFDDGHVDTLNWSIVRSSHGKYYGHESRLLGTALGKQEENSFEWKYTRNAPQRRGSGSVLTFSDWFLLTSDTVLLAQARVTKWGFHVATIAVVYTKTP
jgi:Protein of unknown function (DUF3833)